MAAMCILAGREGLRVHEIAKVKGTDIDFEARTITIVGKGGTMAVLPAHDDLLRHAKLMPLGYWFPSQRQKHIGSRAVTERMHLHMLRQRVPGTPHALRHFFATELVESGADLRVVQELMRHASLSTTAGYVAITDIRMRRAIDMLGRRTDASDGTTLAA